MLVDMLFKKLLASCNKPDSLLVQLKFNITARRYDFYHSLPIIERLALHQKLQHLSEKTKAFTFKYAPKGFGEESTLSTIEILDSRILCNEFDIPIISDVLINALTQLNTINESTPNWLKDIIVDIKQGWKKGKKPYQCDVKNPNQVIDSCAFLTWLETMSVDKLGSYDLRTVSSKLFKDSKRLENIAPTIKALAKAQVPEEVALLKPISVIEYLGVSRFPPFFRVKGSVNFHFKTGCISSNLCWPNIGIPPDGIENITLTEQPSYVLFIENQTTFERYTREVSDNGLVFYTNGFPSRTWQTLIQNIEKLMEPRVHFYHWGDIDVGGYNILAFLQSLFERELKPFRMNPLDYQGSESAERIKTSDLIHCIRKVKQGPIHELRLALENSQLETVSWLEQEFLDVVAIL